MPKRHCATPIANFGSASRPWSTSPSRKEEHFHHITSKNGFTYGPASKNKCRDGACPILVPLILVRRVNPYLAPILVPPTLVLYSASFEPLPHPLNAILFPPIHVWDRAPSIRL